MHQKDVWSKISGRWRQSTHSMCIQRHAVLAMSFSGVQCQETTLNSFLALAFCVLPDVECHRFLFGCQALIELRITLVSCRACGVSWAARGGAALLHRAGLQAARAQGHSRLPAGGHLRQGPAGEPLTSYQLHMGFITSCSSHRARASRSCYCEVLMQYLTVAAGLVCPAAR